MLKRTQSSKAVLWQPLSNKQAEMVKGGRYVFGTSWESGIFCGQTGQKMSR